MENLYREMKLNVNNENQLLLTVDSCGGKGLRITKGLLTQKFNHEFPKRVFTVVGAPP